MPVQDEFLATPGIDEPLDIVEFAGRWDYGEKSLAKMGDRDIIRRWLKQGEESMVEMVDVVFLLTCSRVVSHELVRHRIASYQQESQRFVSYEDEDPDDLFYVPSQYEGNEEIEGLFRAGYEQTLDVYKRLKELGVPKQMARYILPNATRTRIVAKMNLRGWRHFLKLRMHKSAQPEMREIAFELFSHLIEIAPEVFEDIPQWLEEGERAAR
jgi:thymidylate synthase (FAD)